MSFSAPWSEPVFHCPICHSRLVTEQALCPVCLLRDAAAAPNEEPGIDRDAASSWRLCSALDATEQGPIYLAERGDGREVGALHFSAQRVSGSDAVSRIDAERRRLMALQHPGIVPVLDAGVTESGRLFVVFEYVRGRFLREYLQARPRHGDAVEALLTELGRALDHLHQAGLAHGAVSTSSVIVTGTRLDRRARLLGTGVRHLLAVTSLAPAPTAAGDDADLATLRESARAACH